MASLPLDAHAYLAEHLRDERAADDAVVGHVHLQVGDIDDAQAFYVDTLGFEKTTGWHGSALFVSAGGYHHHMAMNTWHSRGAGPRAATLGLGEVSIQVPTRDEVASLTDRLRHRRVPVVDDGATITFDDPWKNLIRVTAAG